MTARRFAGRKRLDWKLLLAIGALHALAIIGLARVFAPDLTRAVVEQATSLVTVTVRTYEEPESEPPPPSAPATPEPEGAAGNAGEEAVPRPETAPSAPIPRPDPAPRASSSGTENRSGASAQGEGTGAGGDGEGTGSGGAGSGQGGIAATPPSVRSGTISAARDFPIPDGGRAIRYGTSVVVEFTVGVDGRASDCRVRQAGPDPATNARVCPLVIERIRFNPARDASGNPVPARYGWRQDFFRP